MNTQYYKVYLIPASRRKTYLLSRLANSASTAWNMQRLNQINVFHIHCIPTVTSKTLLFRKKWKKYSLDIFNIMHKTHIFTLSPPKRVKKMQKCMPFLCLSLYSFYYFTSPPPFFLFFFLFPFVPLFSLFFLLLLYFPFFLYIFPPSLFISLLLFFPSFHLSQFFSQTFKIQFHLTIILPEHFLFRPSRDI